MAAHSHLFPSAPAVSAEWAPIYFEPLSGSGERIVVAIVCRDSNGHGASRIALRNGVLKCMYDDQADMVLGMIELVAESFDDHIRLGHDIGSWIVPSTSCYLGPVRYALGESMESILNQGARLSASLAGDVALTSDDTMDQPESMSVQVDRFVQQVKATVRERVADFEGRFNRTVSVRNGAAPTSIGYLGVRLAANFDVLLPGFTLTKKRTRAKAKLLDLQALKDQVDMFGKREFYELLLWTPPSDSPAYSEADLRRSESVFLELQEIGDKHQLRVEKTASAAAAAKRIFSAEGIGL